MRQAGCRSVPASAEPAPSPGSSRTGNRSRRRRCGPGTAPCRSACAAWRCASWHAAVRRSCLTSSQRQMMVSARPDCAVRRAVRRPWPAWRQTLASAGARRQVARPASDRRSPPDRRFFLRSAPDRRRRCRCFHRRNTHSQLKSAASGRPAPRR